MKWDKKKAQDLLINKKYFGEVSINITNLNEVVYTVKFPQEQVSVKKTN
jgi:hypothetical protein